MGNKKWNQNLYYKKAKMEGYRARSAYKLIQIDKNFGIFTMEKGFTERILDLGCHPGSFIQVILQKYDKLRERGLAEKMFLLGIDRTTTKGFNRSEFEFFRSDVFKHEVEEKLNEIEK